MTSVMRFLVPVLVLAAGFAGFADPARAGTEALKAVPVQDGGRLKPYDTFAREALQLVYGSQKYQGRAAVEIVTTWMLVPQHWDSKPIVEIGHKGLKDALRLPAGQKHFAPEELFRNERLGLVVQELAAKRETKEKLDAYYQAAQRLENQLGLYQMVKTGKAIRLVPPKTGETWVSVAELEGPVRDKFSVLTKAFIQALPVGDNGAPVDTGESPLDLGQAVSDFMATARAENPSAYPDGGPIATEVHYNDLHPFLWTWVLYLVAAILLGFAWHFGKAAPYKAGWAVAILAFLLHTYGFGLRVYLTGRPPVSNMYESVVWVSWGTLLFAFIFEALNRKKFILLAGSVVGVLCLIVANGAPAILDRSLQPLEPVLRSNLWLTVHVLTITISYSAFFLAAGLGNIGLFFVWRGDRATSERVRSITQSVYRAVQIGVVLLAAGTILGGVWADYSWGRFWGWDPKETWAFIALMGYLAVLHARLAGWLQNVGFMASTVLSFSLVIMAWYGVNFVLGAGLHTYGFGGGGVQYVTGVVLLQAIFVGYVLYVHEQSRKKSASAGSSAPTALSANDNV